MSAAHLPPEAYYMVAAVLFSIGAIGVCARRSILVMLMCLELMLSSANLVFVAAARAHGSPDGQVYAFFLIALAACEVAVGLGIVVSVFHARNQVDVDQISEMRG
jgi:NADH-quinone oxidoreductase subunit K